MVKQKHGKEWLKLPITAEYRRVCELFVCLAAFIHSYTVVYFLHEFYWKSFLVVGKHLNEGGFIWTRSWASRLSKLDHREKTASINWWKYCHTFRMRFSHPALGKLQFTTCFCQCIEIISQRLVYLLFLWWFDLLYDKFFPAIITDVINMWYFTIARIQTNLKFPNCLKSEHLFNDWSVKNSPTRHNLASFIWAQHIFYIYLQTSQPQEGFPDPDRHCRNIIPTGWPSRGGRFVLWQNMIECVYFRRKML